MRISIASACNLILQTPSENCGLSAEVEGRLGSSPVRVLGQRLWGQSVVRCDMRYLYAICIIYVRSLIQLDMSVCLVGSFVCFILSGIASKPAKNWTTYLVSGVPDSFI